MRKKLKNHDEERTTFRAIFEREGSKPNSWTGTVERTILLTNVVLVATGERVTQHVWLNYTKGFEQAVWEQGIAEGDTIEFDARVKRYTKGYQGRRLDVWKSVEKDYKLSHPTKFRKSAP